MIDGGLWQGSVVQNQFQRRRGVVVGRLKWQVSADFLIREADLVSHRLSRPTMMSRPSMQQHQ
jgi:hypothetical protein